MILYVSQLVNISLFWLQMALSLSQEGQKIRISAAFGSNGVTHKHFNKTYALTDLFLRSICISLFIIAESRRKVEDQEEGEMLQEAIALSLSQEGQDS